MSRPRRVLASLLCAALLAGGCKDQPEPEPTQDRTLEQLRLEVERVNKGGAPAGPPTSAREAPPDPNERLAHLAAGQESDAPRRLPPVSRKAVPLNDQLEVRVSNLEAMHTVRGTGKLSLTTDEAFLGVTLETRNMGDKPGGIALSGARLTDAANKEYPIARDAQNVGGSRPQDFSLEPSQRQSVVLFFEVPESAISLGLTLLVPIPGGTDVRVPLQ